MQILAKNNRDKTTGVLSLFTSPVLFFSEEDLSSERGIQVGDTKDGKEQKRKPDVIISFNGEKHTLEEWTRQEIAAGKERPLDWSGAFPVKDPTQKHSGFPSEPKAATRPAYRRKSDQAARVIKQFWVPAAAAIVIGLAIGLTMLMLFSGLSKQGATAGEQGASASSGVTQTVKQTDLDLAVFMIQTGVYSTKDKATQSAADLQQRHIPVLIAGGRQSAVFIGISGTRSAAGKLASLFQGQGLSVYVKPFNIKTAKQAAFLQDKRAADFAVKGKDIMQRLLKVADDAADGRQYPSQNTLNQLNKQVNEMNSISIASLNASEKKLIAGVRSSAADAAGTLRTLRTSKDRDAYNGFQQSLLKMISDYQNMIGYTSSSGQQ